MPLDEPGDEGSHRPPPDPLDRLWVHPSELGSGGADGRRTRRGRDWALALAAAAAGALATLGLLAVSGTLDASSGSPRPDRAAVPLELATRAEPSVVGLTVSTITGTPSTGTPNTSTHRASGVCVGPGFVLTSSDAVEGATAVAVTTAAGRSHPATVVGRDPETDLALVKVDTPELRVAEQRAKGSLLVGDSVVALGMGGDSRHWVTAGVVSSLGGLVTTGAGPKRAGLITTDTVVGADAPGGALLDRDGRLVGILTAEAGSQLGIAVPIEVVRDVADQLRASGRATHGWLGVGGTDASDRSGGGIRVTDVVNGSPAAHAGLVRGDIITRLDGAAVPDMVDLLAGVRRRHPGDRLELDVIRDRAVHHLEVTLASTAPSASGATTSSSTVAG
jgi:S1-C subfamily serine protease